MLTTFSIAANVRCYTSSILQSLVAYFIGKKSVVYFGFSEKVARMHQILHFRQPFQWRTINPPFHWERATIVLPHRQSCTTTLHYYFSLHCHGIGITVFLQATTGELLPTFCKGSSTPFPTEKTALSCLIYSISQSFHETMSAVIS